MLRGALFLLVLIPFSLFFCVWCSLLKGTATSEWGQHFWSRLLLWASGSRVETDFSALPAEADSVVFLCNHQSHMDIPILCAALPRRFKIRFVAKKSLFDIPIFGWAMREFGHISIDRSNRRAGMRSIEAAAQKARDGFSPVVFPEGTRNVDPSALMAFKIGGAVVALKCDRPIVPLVMAGSCRLLPKGLLSITPTVIKLKALPPLDASRYTLKERETFRQDMYTLMNAAYQELWAGMGGEVSGAARTEAAGEGEDVF
jgi:1-acyl-sn-glycerol-3-phosphate acyltransferase